MKKEIEIKINANNDRKEMIEIERPFTNKELEEIIFNLSEIVKKIIRTYGYERDIEAAVNLENELKELQEYLRGN